MSDESERDHSSAAGGMAEETSVDARPSEGLGDRDDAGAAEENLHGDPDAVRADEIESLTEPDPDPTPVNYSGTDFDVEGLVRRLARGDIVVPTFGLQDETIETAGFQRRFVWRRPQMDRFIESLLLGYPIPGIFFVEQTDKRYLVLDGQQRLRTLGAYYAGLHDKKEFALQNVADQFKGLTYKTLPQAQRRLLDNTFVQATIVRTDGTTGSLDTVYQIFERLNSGGTQLTPHEIRVALYAGPFIEFLTALNNTTEWRSLYGPESPRLRDQEVVLRFLALYVSPGDYKRPLKKYLNDFVAAHRDLSTLDTATLRARFVDACRLLETGSGPPAIRFRRQVNAALAEAVLVGLARRLDAPDPPDPALVTAGVERLLDNRELVRTIERATADEESVRTRLALATQAFAAI